ncbi:MAG TPA: cytochrome c biogenesis protein CcdA [Polyangia bacterium]
MLDQLLAHVGQYIHTNPWMAIGAVFLGGVVTASSPCVLAMIPLMVSFVAGREERGLGPARAFGYSLVFVLGLALTFVVMGTVAALAGKLYGQVSGAWKWVVAGVCLVMGLHLMGVLRFTIPMPLKAQPKTTGLLGAFVVGLLFGVVSAPCAAPILIVLLTYLAGSGASVPYGALLLLVYALGHSVLILLAGTSMGLARKLIEAGRLTRATGVMRRVAGALIVLVGMYFGYSGLGAPSRAAPAATAAPATAPAAKPRVARIVFVGKQNACDCTRKAIDAGVQALAAALGPGNRIPVERLQLDTQEDKVAPYRTRRAFVALPAVYLIDETDSLVEMFQGEVTKEQLEPLLARAAVVTKEKTP